MVIRSTEYRIATCKAHLFAFSLFAEVGKNYRVESSPDKIELYTAKSIRGTGQKVRFVESRGFLPQEQFYRIRIQE